MSIFIDHFFSVCFHLYFPLWRKNWDEFRIVRGGMCVMEGERENWEDFVIIRKQKGWEVREEGTDNFISICLIWKSNVDPNHGASSHDVSCRSSPPIDFLPFSTTLISDPLIMSHELLIHQQRRKAYFFFLSHSSLSLYFEPSLTFPLFLPPADFLHCHFLSRASLRHLISWFVIVSRHDFRSESQNQEMVFREK